MSSTNLEKLVEIGELKPEKFDINEFHGLLESGKVRFNDAKKEILAEESRFDLAYNAAHSFAFAALRMKGYRPKNRYIVFQVLPSTLGLGPEVWRVLAKCHEKHNLTEYEGFFEIDSQLFKDLISTTACLLDRVSSLPKSL